MWVRGLKPCNRQLGVERQHVAPYVGAWIETKYGDRLKAAETVAPYVGAWIETHSAGMLVPYY